MRKGSTELLDFEDTNQRILQIKDPAGNAGFFGGEEVGSVLS